MTSFRANRRAGFTLTELLVVIAIIGLMMAVALPSFTGMGRGAGIRSATMQLRSTIALARQWAITHREKTYVIFPDATLSYPTRSQIELAQRSYGVYGEKSGMLKEWTMLPQGVIFNTAVNRPADYGGENGFFNLLNAKTLVVAVGDDGTAFNLPFPNTNSTPQSVFALAFSPDGRSANTDWQKYSLYFSEGFTEIDKTAGTLTVAQLKPDGMTFGIEVLPLTGQMRIREL